MSRRPAGRRGIDGGRAGERIDDRLLQVFERDFVGSEGVAGVFKAARGDEAVLGDEVGVIELADGGGAEADEAGVLACCRFAARARAARR